MGSGKINVWGPPLHRFEVLKEQALDFFITYLLGTENTIIVPEINMGGISSGGIQAKERR